MVSYTVVLRDNPLKVDPRDSNIEAELLTLNLRIDTTRGTTVLLV